MFIDRGRARGRIRGRLRGRVEKGIVKLDYLSFKMNAIDDALFQEL